MTEREAWLKIAEAFDKPLIQWEQEERDFKQYPFIGICGAIIALEETGDIDIHIYRQMRNKIEPTEGQYLFPRNNAGDKERAKFCLAQAERCK